MTTNLPDASEVAKEILASISGCCCSVDLDSYDSDCESHFPSEEKIEMVKEAILRDREALLGELSKSADDFAYIKKILPNENEAIDHILKERPHELYHYLCVDVPTVIEEALARLERVRKGIITPKEGV